MLSSYYTHIIVNIKGQCKRRKASSETRCSSCTANIPMNYLLGAAPLSNGEGPGPLFGPPLKTSIFHNGALIFPGFLVGDWETTQLHNIAQLAPSPLPQQHRPPPSSSKDAADVLWQRQISHKCNPCRRGKRHHHGGDVCGIP